MKLDNHSFSPVETVFLQCHKDPIPLISGLKIVKKVVDSLGSSGSTRATDIIAKMDT